MDFKQVVLWAGLCIVVAPARLSAIEEWENEEGSLYLSLAGAERLNGVFFHVPELENLYPEGDDGMAASVTRLLFDGMAGDHIKFEINLFNDISSAPVSTRNSAFSTAGSFESPYRNRYLVGTFWEDGAVSGRAGVDRLNVSVAAEPFSITAGRLPVNHSVTQIFAPNDFFVPFSVTAINTMYKPGVDAIEIDYAPGMLSLVQLTTVLGSDQDGAPDWGRSAMLLHARVVFHEVEFAAVGGKLAKRWVSGGSVQGAAGPINIRAEGHVGFPDTDGNGSMDDIDGDGRVRDGVHARLAVGGDTFFSWHNTSLGLEYLYLSDGAESADRYFERIRYFYPDDQLFLGRHYAGLLFATEIIPILRTSAMVLMNLEDGSGMGALTFIYSISDEADFVAGTSIPFGRRQSEQTAREEPFAPKSEYGHVPLNLFLESRFFF
jgi:hypothetical protein